MSCFCIGSLEIIFCLCFGIFFFLPAHLLVACFVLVCLALDLIHGNHKFTKIVLATIPVSKSKRFYIFVFC